MRRGTNSGNVQSRARALRYRLLGDWAQQQDLAFVAVAHHRDDVAESFLMRALRGSGLRGLARMAAVCPMPYVPHVTLIRPLLNWSRAELAEIVAQQGLQPVSDPSNADDRYDRIRIRKQLAAEPALDPAALATAAANLADAERALEWVVEHTWQSRADCSAEGEILIDSLDLPREIRRRLAARAVSQLATDWSGDGIAPFVDRLDGGKSGTLAGVEARISTKRAHAWQFRIAPPRRESR